MATCTPEVLAQIHLTGESDCPLFKPHMLKPNFCVECNKLISKHSPEAVPGDSCILKAIEFSQKGEKVPSRIIAASEGKGGLFHGGFRGVMNKEFLVNENITHVLNTAKRLEIFGPKYLSALEAARGRGVVFLNLDWEDTEQFTIPYHDLDRASEFIHTGRVGGGSVLVHCAQGKSRSSTAVIAYLLATNRDSSFESCLELVQEQRKMAQPNPTFAKLLVNYTLSDNLKQLRQQLTPV